MLHELDLVVRVGVAVVWTMVTVRAYRLHRSGYLRKLLAQGTIAVVLWGIVLRGLTILGILPDAVTGPLFTVTLFVAFVVGVTLLTTEPDL